LIVTLVVLVLVLVVGGAGAFLYVRSNHGSASAGTPTAQSTASTSGVTPVATPGGVTPTIISNGLNTVGTPVQAGNDWLVTVTSVKETNGGLVPPGSNNTYLEINLTLKNTSGKSETLVSYLYFTLDSGKHETLGDTNVRHTPDGSVGANQTLDAQIAFEVPKSQHSFTFTFAYGLSHNTGDKVSWQLTA
jgi:flagellar basal body-associated protein FliL